MGKRGPKPLDIGLLSTWEFQFYKAFHLLRDGTPLPQKQVSLTGLSRDEVSSFLEQLKRMSSEQYWLTTRRFAVEMGEEVDVKKPPVWMERWWAEQERAQEIYWLARTLNPPPIRAAVARRKIWNDLVRADTYAALRKACGRWAQLPDVRRAGLSQFSRQVLRNASQFFNMKRNQRFPRSSYGDNARLEYLARGMAGVVCGLSPMTAIERLRNMKHDRSGPLWVTRHANYSLPENEQYCGCWRCSMKRSNQLGVITQTSYDNGLRLFVELAKTTKVPREWRVGR